MIYEVVFENTDVITNKTNEVRENISNVENSTTTYNSTQQDFIEVSKKISLIISSLFQYLY